MRCPLARGGAVDFYNKRVALKAFERLLDLEILTPVEKAGAHVAKEYRQVRLMVTADHSHRQVPDAYGAPAMGRRWSRLWALDASTRCSISVMNADCRCAASARSTATTPPGVSAMQPMEGALAADSP